MSYKYILNKLL